jgi:hypothetical protein
MTDARRPVHLAVLLGVSACAYAVSLAAVTALQSHADARLAAAREPIGRATDAVAADRRTLEAAVEDVARRYSVLADRYRRSGLSLEEVEASLDELATRAADVSESAASLPTRFRLPSVGAAPRSVAAPATHATTGASG